MRADSLGKKGEEFTASMLIGRGMYILDRNYTSRYGEIDVIAADGDTICFVEVKTRRQNGMVSGMQAVTAAKRRKIIRTAMVYLQERPHDLQPRFDVCAVVADTAGNIVEYDYLTGAFDGEGNI